MMPIFQSAPSVVRPCGDAPGADVPLDGSTAVTDGIADAGPVFFIAALATSWHKGALPDPR